MVNYGLLVRLEAQHGKEAAVEEFLRSALPIVRGEPGTVAWFAIRFGKGEYGIFDVFPDDAARSTHLTGPVANALMQRAGELFSKSPEIRKITVLADKLPSGNATEPVTKGLLLTFKAKSNHESQVEEFLRDAQHLVVAEPKTTAWFALSLGDGEYGIFDVFPDNAGRFAHLTGHVPRELARHSLSLLGSVPDMELLNILADKLPA